MLLVIMIILSVFGIGATCLVQAFSPKRGIESVLLHGFAGLFMMYFGTYIACMV